MPAWSRLTLSTRALSSSNSVIRGGHFGPDSLGFMSMLPPARDFIYVRTSTNQPPLFYHHASCRLLTQRSTQPVTQRSTLTATQRSARTGIRRKSGPRALQLPRIVIIAKISKDVLCNSYRNCLAMGSWRPQRSVGPPGNRYPRTSSYRTIPNVQIRSACPESFQAISPIPARS